MARGRTLLLGYEVAGYTWADSFDGAILQRVGAGQLLAASAGHTTVVSTGTPICQAFTPCSHLQRQVQFGVIVS